MTVCLIIIFAVVYFSHAVSFSKGKRGILISFCSALPQGGEEFGQNRDVCPTVPCQGRCILSL